MALPRGTQAQSFHTEGLRFFLALPFGEYPIPAQVLLRQAFRRMKDSEAGLTFAERLL